MKKDLDKIARRYYLKFFLLSLFFCLCFIFINAIIIFSGDFDDERITNLLVFSPFTALSFFCTGWFLIRLIKPNSLKYIKRLCNNSANPKAVSEQLKKTWREGLLPFYGALPNSAFGCNYTVSVGHNERARMDKEYLIAPMYRFRFWVCG